MYPYIKVTHNLPKEQPIKIPDTKRPKGRVRPTEGMAKKYHIKK